jgi:WD40 repeat protein
VSDTRRDRDATASFSGVSGAAPSSSHDELDPARFPVVDPGRYELHGEIARGGLGRILKARDVWLDRMIAIKELLHGGPEAELRFVREAAVTARLAHPAIIPVHEAGRWPSGEPFYTMNLISGRTLKELIAERPGFEERLALLPCVTTVAEAVAHAHAEGVVHRDLKPANILVGPFGETVVIDWGLTRPLSGTTPDPSPRESGEMLTSPGAIIGTPAFMPPEQAGGGEVDERADVYALGAVLYHLLGGEPPYSGPAEDILTAVSKRAPRPLAEREPAIAADLCAIVDRAMARDARDRYPGARELADDLRRYLAGQLVSAHRYSNRLLAARWASRHRVALSVAALSLLLLALVGAVGLVEVLRERAAALRQADELTLLHARSVLDRDPTSALAWLKTYRPAADAWPLAADIAADARSRGVARLVLRGHEGTVRAVSFSPDGSMLASIGDDQQLLLRDPHSGRALGELDARQQSLGRLTFSPDGRWIASAGVAGSVWLWQPNTGARRQLTGHEHLVLDLDFAPDGSRLVSAGADGTVRLWTVNTPAGESTVLTRHDGPAEVARFVGAVHVVSCGRDGSVRLWNTARATGQLLGTHDGACETMTVSRDGRVATGGADGVVRVWQLSPEPALAQALPQHHKMVTALAFTPDGSRLASSGADGSVRLWDLDTAHSRLVVEHRAEVRGLAFSPDGRFLASSGFSGLVDLHELASGASMRLLGHGSRVYDVAFSPDGRMLASGSNDKTVRLWSVPPPRSVVLSGSSGEVYHAVYSPDGRWLATDGRDHVVRIWDRTGGLVHALAGHEDTVCSVGFSPDGRWLASSGWDRSVRLWDMESGTGSVLAQLPGIAWQVTFSADGRLIVAADGAGGISLWHTADFVKRRLTGHDGDVLEVAIAGDGHTLASAGLDGTIRLWNVENGAARVLRGHEGRIYRIVLSADGRKLASAGRDGSVRLWDVRRGVGHVLGRHDQPVRDVAFSADGETLVSASEDRTLRVWDLTTGRWRSLRGHDDVVRSLAFTPRGARVASGGQDGTVRLWDLETGAREVLRGHTAYVLAVAYAPDGKEIASAGADGSVRLFQPRREELVPADAPALSRWLARATSERIAR